ncbi:hypothetical protein [Thermaurantiacus sp.]
MTIKAPPAGEAVAQALAEALIDEAARVAGKEWQILRHDLEPRLRALGDDAERAAAALRAGRMTPGQARQLLQLQRLALGSILRHGRVLAAVRAHALVDGLMRLAGERLGPPGVSAPDQRL